MTATPWHASHSRTPACLEPWRQALSAEDRPDAGVAIHLETLVPSSDGVSRIVPHISNITYVQWLDQVAERHADAWGWDRETLLRHGVMWFVARHEIDYLAEAWPDEPLWIGTWVESVERVKSWRRTEIVHAASGRRVCHARTLWVLVDLERRRPTRIPDTLRRALGDGP